MLAVLLVILLTVLNKFDLETAISVALGQYFKRRRELLEIFVVSGRGIGLCLLYTFVRTAIRYVYLVNDP